MFCLAARLYGRDVRIYTAAIDDVDISTERYGTIHGGDAYRRKMIDLRVKR